MQRDPGRPGLPYPAVLRDGRAPIPAPDIAGRREARFRYCSVLIPAVTRIRMDSRSPDSRGGPIYRLGPGRPSGPPLLSFASPSASTGDSWPVPLPDPDSGSGARGEAGSSLGDRVGDAREDRRPGERSHRRRRSFRPSPQAAGRSGPGSVEEYPRCRKRRAACSGSSESPRPRGRLPASSPSSTAGRSRPASSPSRTTPSCTTRPWAWSPTSSPGRGSTA
jgi:hypothetical protein